MSRLIVLYNYNKYYNRIIKKKSTFQEYLNLITPGENTPAAYRGFIRENLNFDYQDGVYASHIINIRKDDPQYMKIEHPDYCVLEQSYVEGTGDEVVTTTKISRYFILEVKKVRGNQWEYSMRRDLLADYYDEVMTAPVFIEKGWLNSLNDPAIFNKESMTFNQIKKNELILSNNKYSGRGGGWIVGYLAKEDTPTALGPAIGQAELPPDVPDYAELSSTIKYLITHGTGYKYYNNEAIVTFLADAYKISGLYNPYGAYSIYDNGNVSDITVSKDVNTWTWALRVAPYGSFLNIILEASSGPSYDGDINEFYSDVVERYQENYSNNQILDKFDDIYVSENPGDFTTADASIMAYNNTYYKGADNKYYKISITREFSNEDNYFKRYTKSQLQSGSDALAIKLYNFLQQMISRRVVENPNLQGTDYTIGVGRFRYCYKCSVQEVDFSEVSVTISASRNKLLDAPYDMFCIPLGIVSVYNSGNLVLTPVLNTALAAGRALAVKGGSLRIYDIQILPYCPYPEALNNSGDIDITGLTAGKDYSYIQNNLTSANVNIVLYPLRCKGTFDFDILQNEVSSDIWDFCNKTADYVIRKKIKSETRLTRFVSPNFASMFEINVEKNEGITHLNVDYFYKPYTPYLHIAPYFSGLYGQDFNDPKGLICSGDFSMATASSKWEEYQIQNKNFEVMFDRQIQNLDINNSLAYQVAEKSSGIGVATSALTGLGAGAAAGAMVGSFAGPVGTAIGGAVGAVVGGVGGGVTSAIGRKYDLEYLAKSQAEARSYAVDMYGYNLGNIKALPNTLTKVSAFTENNKIFPFIEFYDCTEQERTDFTAKLRYNGMTIMRIGKIEDYLGEYNYVSGQLIRLTGIDEDGQVIAEIAKEIKEGAYYYGTDSE